jgi:hypothetical protein
VFPFSIITGDEDCPADAESAAKDAEKKIAKKERLEVA